VRREEAQGVGDQQVWDGWAHRLSGRPTSLGATAGSDGWRAPHHGPTPCPPFRDPPSLPRPPGRSLAPGLRKRTRRQCRCRLRARPPARLLGGAPVALRPGLLRATRRGGPSSARSRGSRGRCSSIPTASSSTKSAQRLGRIASGWSSISGIPYPAGEHGGLADGEAPRREVRPGATAGGGASPRDGHGPILSVPTVRLRHQERRDLLRTCLVVERETGAASSIASTWLDELIRMYGCERKRYGRRID